LRSCQLLCVYTFLLLNQRLGKNTYFTKSNYSFEKKALLDLIIAFCYKSFQTILSTIKDEVQCKEHKDLGCHVLVIMTHGGVNNYIYGVDRKRVRLTDVYDLLTPLNFPGMSGKPKIVILETCSGSKCFLWRKAL